MGVYGADLDTLDAVAAQIAAVMKTVPGAVDVQVHTPPKTPVVRVDLDFPALARYGIAPADALAAVGAAYQGAAGAKIFQETRTVDIAVTTPPDLRRDPESVGDLLIRSSTGTAVPLKSIAKVYLTDARTSVSHEGGRPRQAVSANPAPRNVAKVAKAVQAAVDAKVKLPPGVFLEYAGTAQGAAEARKELLFNTALAIGGVVALLLLAFGSGRATVLILGATPFALVGGVIAVAVTGGSLSLGSLVGFVTLFGVAARNAILLIARPRSADRRGGPSLVGGDGAAGHARAADAHRDDGAGDRPRRPAPGALQRPGGPRNPGSYGGGDPGRPDHIDDRQPGAAAGAGLALWARADQGRFFSSLATKGARRVAMISAPWALGWMASPWFRAPLRAMPASRSG